MYENNDYTINVNVYPVEQRKLFIRPQGHKMAGCPDGYTLSNSISCFRPQRHKIYYAQMGSFTLYLYSKGSEFSEIRKN